MKVTQSLKRAVSLRGDSPALIHNGHSWSYVQLRDKVARLASLFVLLGVEPDDRVAMISNNSDYYWCFYYASIWSGAIMVPMNHRLSAAEMSEIINDCSPKIVLHDQAALEKVFTIKEDFPNLDLLLCKTTSDESLMQLGKYKLKDIPPIADRSGSGDDIAEIVYTGGTTGRPKGVMLTHTNIVSNALNTIPYLNLSEDTIQLHVGPFFHVGAGQRVFTVTQAAGTHVILPAFKVPDIMQHIQEYRINSIVLVPTMMRRILDHPDRETYDLSSLKYVSYGAAPMPNALLQRFMLEFPDCLLSQSYGQTECSPVATGLLHRDHLPNGPYGCKLGTVGRSVSTVEVRIGTIDSEMDNGEVGEVLVKGPNVMRGYWNNPIETSKTIINGWLHTGDVGYLDKHHFLVIVDRLKDMIITGGENVYSSEVENIISQAPNVENCAIIGLPCDQWGEKVHAILRGTQVPDQVIIDFCRQHLAGYKIPRSIEWITEPFPLTPTNKINKKLLKETRVKQP